jgi:hypothetical protein
MVLGKRVVWIGIGVIWVAALVVCMDWAMKYESTPGRAASRAPLETPKAGDRWTVVVVAHPLCPCTAASLRALRALAAKHSDELKCEVVFAGDRPVEPSDSMRTADVIATAKVRWMTAQKAEEEYGTYTSGQAFVYDPNGKLVYSGGLTPGRGVEQPRYALELFDNILARGQATKPTPVFGCALREKQDDDRSRQSSRT